ncbi:hypothetical protein [Streptomyces lydicus]|uniref:hypothetical protein n=1 Tax=Streptomyces lydicus TaxID=47763 RepID=UPI0037167534
MSSHRPMVPVRIPRRAAARPTEPVPRLAPERTERAARLGPYRAAVNATITATTRSVQALWRRKRTSVSKTAAAAFSGSALGGTESR